MEEFKIGDRVEIISDEPIECMAFHGKVGEVVGDVDNAENMLYVAFLGLNMRKWYWLGVSRDKLRPTKKEPTLISRDELIEDGWLPASWWQRLLSRHEIYIF